MIEIEIGTSGFLLQNIIYKALVAIVTLRDWTAIYSYYLLLFKVVLIIIYYICIRRCFSTNFYKILWLLFMGLGQACQLLELGAVGCRLELPRARAGHTCPEA